MTFTNDDDDDKDGVILDPEKIAAMTEEWKKERRAMKNKRAPSRADVEARLALEERAAREDDQHEISNAQLGGYRRHRRVHRGEKFENMTAADVPSVITHKKCVRLDHDAKLVELLGKDRMRAMTVARAAFLIITSGINMQTFNPSKIRGGRRGEEGLKMVETYWAWGKKLLELKLEHSLCLEIAVFGYSISECEKKHHRGHRTVTANLLACLDVAVNMGMHNLMKDED